MIILTKVVQPEAGAIFAMHCRDCGTDGCGKTVITLSEYAVKPKDGDLWVTRGVCPESDPRHLDFFKVERPYFADTLMRKSSYADPFHPDPLKRFPFLRRAPGHIVGQAT